MTADPLAVWCPVCGSGPGQRCGIAAVGLDPFRSLIHLGRAMDAEPGKTCEHCGNEDASMVLALCLPCAESIP